MAQPPKMQYVIETAPGELIQRPTLQQSFVKVQPDILTKPITTSISKPIVSPTRKTIPRVPPPPPPKTYTLRTIKPMVAVQPKGPPTPPSGGPPTPQLVQGEAVVTGPPTAQQHQQVIAKPKINWIVIAAALGLAYVVWQKVK